MRGKESKEKRKGMKIKKKTQLKRNKKNQKGGKKIIKKEKIT